MELIELQSFCVKKKGDLGGGEEIEIQKRSSTKNLELKKRRGIALGKAWIQRLSKRRQVRHSETETTRKKISIATTRHFMWSGKGGYTRQGEGKEERGFTQSYLLPVPPIE